MHQEEQARDVGSLVQPVLCTAYWSRVPVRSPLFILSPSACETVTHLFPSRSLPRTRKDGARDAGFPPNSLPRTRKDSARDAGFLSPPTTTSLTTRVHTHVAGENEPRSRIETLFIENHNSSKHPPVDMTRLSHLLRSV